MNKINKTSIKKVALPATLKEAVQGRNEIPSATILGIDVDQFKRSIDLFKYSLDYAEAIVNTVREPLVVLNKELQVITANRAFYQTFHVHPDKLENRPFYELGGGRIKYSQIQKAFAKCFKKRY